MMSWVKSAQSLDVWLYRSSSPVPPIESPGCPSSVAILLNPLLLNGGDPKSTIPKGGPRLIGTPANAASTGAFGPTRGRMALATGLLKQVGEPPGASGGASRLGGAPPATKFAATRQFANASY